MGELINGRTPEQIQFNVMECAHGYCLSECPYDSSDKCTEDLLGDAFALIRHLKAKVPKWISVKDELPPRELNILAVNGHGRIKIMALWKKEDKRWTWIEDSRFTHRNDITHWMLLPKQPNNE